MFKEIVEIEFFYVFVKDVLFGFFNRGVSVNYLEIEYG